MRQRDPISPILFYFISDALNKILSSAASVGHILVMASDLLPAGVTHLQYAHDTIILAEKNDQRLANLKFLLHCFEALSGLKINLNKSEAFVLGYILLLSKLALQIF